MAYETELANYAVPTDEISVGISRALVKTAVMPSLIYSEDIPSSGNVKKFRKDGSLTAESLAQSTEYTFSASSELTQASASATIAKTVVVSKLTLEALKMGGVDANLPNLQRKQAEAISRILDSEILALFTGLGTGVTATNVMTIGDLFTAIMNIEVGLGGGARMIYAGGAKQIKEMKVEQVTSGAAIWSQPQRSTLLSGALGDVGFKGEVGGALCYQVSGLSTSGGDDVSAVFNPDIAFAAAYDTMIEVWSVDVVSGGFYKEIGSAFFHKAVEWNEIAGEKILSDT